MSASHPRRTAGRRSGNPARPPIRALAYKTWRHTANIGRVIRRQSPFQVLFIVAFAVAFEFGLYAIFMDAFRFLDRLGGAGRLILNQLFALFFMGMGAMLVVSSMVTGYATIFRSDEIPFLLTHPVPLPHIVIYQYLKSSLFASWAFGFVVIPFVAAYASFLELSPWFALWTFCFSVPFLLLCTGLGSIVVLTLVRWSPTGRLLKLLAVAAIAVGLALAWNAWRGAYRPTPETEFTLSRLVPGMRPAINRLSPTWWIAGGILALSRSEWLRGTLLWGVLTSTALMVAGLVEALGSATFLTSWRNVSGGVRAGRRAPILFPRAEARLGFLPPDVRAIMLKDLRIFFRDATQWTQALVFFGLLALYFANLRNFNYHLLPDTWRHAVTFLNVFSVSAVICSLGSRFIYPQLSLEGHGFWVLGLSPVSTTRVVMAKFLGAVAALLPVSIALMLLSGAMLEAALPIRLLTVAMAACIALAVCGLSTGLGAVYLDPDSTNPSAIVSSFGGTLNLVLTLAVMLLTILPFGMLFHLRAGGFIRADRAPWVMFLAILWLTVLTASATGLPLLLGCRAMRRRDF